MIKTTSNEMITNLIESMTVDEMKERLAKYMLADETVWTVCSLRAGATFAAINTVSAQDGEPKRGKRPPSILFQDIPLSLFSPKAQERGSELQMDPEQYLPATANWK